MLDTFGNKPRNKILKFYWKKDVSWPKMSILMIKHEMPENFRCPSCWQKMVTLIMT